MMIHIFEIIYNFVFVFVNTFPLLIIPNTIKTTSICRESSVGIARGYWLDGQGSIPTKGKRFLSNPQCPNLLPNE
jgi:hypothetical protein